jgi:mannose-1-phosphate guanylyltransferase
MKNTYAVIMAGGSGTRFWPLSKHAKPKQFLDILGTGQSLLQITFERFAAYIPEENIYIVSNEKYEQIIKEQLPTVRDDQVLLEPYQRNTAPCIAYACYKIAKANPDATVVVSPSDHAIFKEKEFYEAVKKAITAVKGQDKLVTIGVSPNRPETGYGYIQYYSDADDDVKPVKTFTEKPELELAEKFVESGDFVWNAGVFVWNVSSIQKAFAEFLPEIDEVFQQISANFYTSKEKEGIGMAYAQCKNISIDYGVMEKAQNVYVVLGDFAWSDLGSWDSLYEVNDKDEKGNVVEGNALLFDSSNCLIKGPDNKLIVVNGLDDCLVAYHEDALLITKKGREKQLRAIVNEVKLHKDPRFL